MYLHSFAIRLRRTRLGLFCIERVICRAFSTVVEGGRGSPAEKQVSVHRGQALGEKLDKIWGSVTMRENPDLIFTIEYLLLTNHESVLAGPKSLWLSHLRHAN